MACYIYKNNKYRSREELEYFLIEEVIQFQKELSNKGIEPIVNGFVHNNTVYLNENSMGLDTPIHEFGHLYLNALENSNPQLYKEGLSKVNTKEAKEYIDYVKATQPNLEEGSEKFNEEVLAQVIGDSGAKLIESKKKGSLSEWLNEFWNFIKDKLGLSQYSIEDVKNMTLGEYAEAISVDLLQGNKMDFNNLATSPSFQINSSEHELQQIKEQAIANGTFMKAPNGKDTNLNERQWLQVRSRAFTDWFGDWINDPQNASKVVDENGEPLVIYRGDNEEFTEFDKSKTKGARYGKLFNFTSDKSFAYQHGNLRSFFVNSRNPLDIDSIGNDEIDKLIEGINKILGEPMDKFSEDNFRENPYELIDTIIKSDKFITALSYAGYTGAQELSYNEVQAVIDPNQIKSATDNIGTFSSDSNDIRYQRQNNSLSLSSFLEALSVDNLDILGGAEAIVQQYEQVASFMTEEEFIQSLNCKL